MESTGDTWRLGHRPALDGLRGIAVLLVVAGHALWIAPLGSAGVTIFFVLSGFLITSLIVEEQAANGGRLNLRRFYARRAKRLFPALAVVLLIVGAWQVALGLTGVGALLPVVFYVSNWAAAVGQPQGLLSHTWSLAVEEQFYLLWPLLLLLIRRARPLIVCTAAAIIVATVTRWALWDGGDGYARIYNATDTRADAILVGCLLAFAAHSRELPRLPAWAPGVGLLAVVTVGLVNTDLTAAAIIPTVVPWISALVIWACCVAPPRWLTGRVLTYFGRRSYGLYLWHVPLVYGIGMLFGYGWSTVVALALSLALTEVSWRFVEQPFLRLKHRPAGGVPGQEAAVALV